MNKILSNWMRPAGRSSKKHLATLMSAACGLALTVSVDAAVQPITTQGNQVLFGGQPGSVSGMSLFWDIWGFEKYYNANTVGWLAQDWNAKLVRVAIAVEEGGADSVLSNPAMHKARVKAVVDAAVANDIYVIIDWHSIGNLAEEKYHRRDAYRTTKLETIEFWSTMGRHYAADNTVAFFELFNEPALGGPLGDSSWQQWKQIMEEIISAIRTNGGTAVPLVAGFDFGYDLTPVAKAPINAEGIGYVSHPYAMKRKAPWPEQWTKDWGFVSDTYPVFATEVGFCPADDKQAHIPVIGDETYGDALTSYFEKRGISYAVWCFDPDCAPALIKDWSFTPTRQGVYFKKVFLQRTQSAKTARAN